MSYEGYEQLICKKGHLTIVDCWHDGASACSICGKEIVWCNPVDQTNGEEVGLITKEDLDKHFLIEPQKMCKCETCGNTHQIAPPLYEIKDIQLARDLRTKWRNSLH